MTTCYEYNLLMTVQGALRDAARGIEEAAKANSLLLALHILRNYEKHMPGTTTDGYTSHDAVEIVGVVQSAAAAINPAHGMTIRMVWEYKDRWGFGGDSGLMAFKPFHAGGYAMYSIPILCGIATAEETFEALWGIFDNCIPAFGHAKELPPGALDDGFNTAWKVQD